MTSDRDHFDAYYADKIWQLLPEVYRAQDVEGDDLEAKGPLRELVERIGAQAAIVRRSIDRLWDDQSIETSDDWLIPYIGDLLATNLVGGLGPRGQRLDVAKTVYYRRRKGTVALLEELAADVTSWEVRVVEFFRRMGRTRHNFDPTIGRPENSEDPEAGRALQLAEGLVGRLTHSTIGGFADLRNAYGARQARTAFDEFYSSADLRRGVGNVGWYNIPRLGVFLWRLYSFEVEESTPVAVQDCPDQYVFDPTGRELPLFARNARQGSGFDAQWVSPEEWQLPTPITRYLLRDQLEQVHTPLIEADVEKLYPGSLSVLQLNGSFYDVVEKPDLLYLDPVRGRFKVAAAVGTPRVSYHYGFSSRLGAGTYDRRVLHAEPPARPEPQLPPRTGGGDLTPELNALGANGTLTLGDSLTYDTVADLNAVEHLTLRAENRQRPVVRLPAGGTWSFTGAADDSTLVLDGLLVSGGDVVIAGRFDRVQLNCCTFDPGNAGEAAGSFATAVDGRDLLPAHLRIEGTVGELLVERCITGPVLVSGAGELARLTVRDSIVQSLWDETAIDLPDVEAELVRCTVLGPGVVRRLEASECILDDVMTVDDNQHGCVRFSAWSTGSVIPSPYESVEIAAKAPLFTSRAYGQPGYAQLLSGVDAQIVGGHDKASIAEGAEDGSEMGAFWQERTAIKLRSLAIKYEEFMPLGMVPVFIPVT